MSTIQEKLRAEAEWAQSGQWTAEQAANRILYLVRAELIQMPRKEWDVLDADSAEAREARAYNSALTDAWKAFREQG